MCPEPCRRRVGRTAPTAKNTPFTFTTSTSTVHSQSSTRTFSRAERGMTPALFTRRSIRPQCARQAPATPSTARRSVMSAGSTRARPPLIEPRGLSSTRAATASRRSTRQSVSATQYPAEASATAVASPIPLDAPVTIATGPWRPSYSAGRPFSANDQCPKYAVRAAVARTCPTIASVRAAWWLSRESSSSAGRSSAYRVNR